MDRCKNESALPVTATRVRSECHDGAMRQRQAILRLGNKVTGPSIIQAQPRRRGRTTDDLAGPRIETPHLEAGRRKARPMMA
jgi:hypothetical protein